MSPNTISSYRDTFKLFLTYCKQSGLSIERLTFAQVDETLILAFVKWLEEKRNNGISTRNQRLACIHAFFRYVQTEHPVGLVTYQKILAIPMKKAPKPTVNHLTPDSLQLILAQPDLKTSGGRRDATLLSVLYDTGARVQELVDLRVRDVRLDPPPVLSITGKGSKTRHVPLMSNTEAVLRQYMTENHLLQNGMLDRPLFCNRQRRKMTREGVAFILDKYVSLARTVTSAIPEKVTPHVLRHTKAMHLLQAGVNLIYIRDLLGHVDIATTEVYARADTELKRKALEQAYPNMVSEGLPQWNQDEDLIAWLTSI